MKNITSKRFGAILQGLRKKVAMEQEMVARALNIPRTAVTAFEAGNREVTVMELVDLCKLYRMSPNEILGWDKFQARNIEDPIEEKESNEKS